MTVKRNPWFFVQKCSLFEFLTIFRNFLFPNMTVRSQKKHFKSDIMSLLLCWMKIENKSRFFCWIFLDIFHWVQNPVNFMTSNVKRPEKDGLDTWSAVPHVRSFTSSFQKKIKNMKFPKKLTNNIPQTIIHNLSSIIVLQPHVIIPGFCLPHDYVCIENYKPSGVMKNIHGTKFTFRLRL